MENRTKFYINGEWVEPLGDQRIDVINPATESVLGQIAQGTAKDVDRAVAAAVDAFESYSQGTKEQRLELIDAIIVAYGKRVDEMAETISQEMGAPMALAQTQQVPAGIIHLLTAKQTLEDFEFEETLRATKVYHEPIGVCGFITPWNWPINQIVCKVAPALACGCTMILKPSEVAPFSGLLFAEILHEAGVPPGVFNLVNGDGPAVGAALASHPHIDMVSFTGSTRAGIEVAKNAAPTVKRVTQELGGKAPNILLDDVDFESVVSRDVILMCSNSGQNCNAPSRMLVPNSRMEAAAAIAKVAAESITVGDPSDPTTIGPVVSERQFEQVQSYIDQGIKEGAKVETGGPGKPDGLEVGYYVKPTIFSHATNDMTIAREEIFGPVLTLIGYEDEDDAVGIANDTIYGLSAYVSSSNSERAMNVARRIRAGHVHINGAPLDPHAPFGGYKQSGNGREWGRFGFEEFLETKAVMGYES